MWRLASQVVPSSPSPRRYFASSKFGQVTCNAFPLVLCFHLDAMHDERSLLSEFTFKYCGFTVLVLGSGPWFGTAWSRISSDLVLSENIGHTVPYRSSKCLCVLLSILFGHHWKTKYLCQWQCHRYPNICWRNEMMILIQKNEIMVRVGRCLQHGRSKLSYKQGTT